MKTMNLLTGNKNLIAVALILFCISSINAQYPYDNAILAFNNPKKTSMVVEKSSPKDYTDIESMKDIYNWIDTEMTKAVEKAHLEECRITTTVNLELDKNGNIAKYKIKDKNCEVGFLLDNVLKNAPSFKPVTMNGYASRIQYEIPVTVEIR